MGLNPMESAGCFAIIKALQKNLTTKLEFIDFSVILLYFLIKNSINKFKKIFFQQIGNHS